MKENDYYIRIPYEIIDADVSREYLLPIYIALQFRRGLSGRIYTSLADLLSEAGYQYNSHAVKRGYIQGVLSALQWLDQQSYIELYENPTTRDALTTLSDLKPTTPFNILMSQKNHEEQSYIKLYLREYEILETMYWDGEYKPKWRPYMLFCYIVRHFQFDKTIDASNLHYYNSNLDKVAEGVLQSTNRARITELLEKLDHANLLHYTTLPPLKTKLRVINGSHIIVRHSDFWERDLQMAKNRASSKRYNYFLEKGLISLEKGGKSDRN